MLPRTFALSLAPVFVASLAHAQAPGQYGPAAPPAPPPGDDDPVEAQPAAPAPEAPPPTYAQPPQPQYAPPQYAPPQYAPPGYAQPQYAQPPAQYPQARYPQPAPYAAQPAPCQPCPCEAPAIEPALASRWSLAFSVGSLSLSPEGQPDNDTAFTVGELALRYRATRHLELEVAAGGGRERLDNHEMGDREVVHASLALRYRFAPERPWNWFLMAGLGGAAITRHDATDQERDDAMQPMGMLGIGVERRFRHFALQAEARAIGLAERQRDEVVIYGAPAMPGAPAPFVYDPANERKSGGSLTLGLSYYF